MIDSASGTLQSTGRKPGDRLGSALIRLTVGLRPPLCFANSSVLNRFSAYPPTSGGCTAMDHRGRNERQPSPSLGARHADQPATTARDVQRRLAQIN